MNKFKQAGIVITGATSIFQEMILDFDNLLFALSIVVTIIGLIQDELRKREENRKEENRVQDLLDKIKELEDADSK